MVEWVPVSGGKSGARVWRGGDVYRKEGEPGEIAAEAARLVWLAGQGFPCAEVVGHEPGTLVTRALAGRPGSADWPSAMRPALAAGLGDLLRVLHQVPVAGCPFDRRLGATVALAEANARAGEVDLTDLDGSRLGWSAPRLLAELHATRPQGPEDLVVGHGDPCLPNILFDEDGRPTGVVDVSRLGVADRHNDLAIATRSVGAKWSLKAAGRLLAAYGLREPDLAKIAFYRLLDEFF